jgi:phage gpG-like protein
MKNIKLIINNDYKKEKEKFFVKKELQCILNLYAKMVSNGSWKDYSFSSCTKEVSFDVYQRASDRPFLRILKNLKPNYYNEKYLIKDKNGNILKKSENLNQLISKTSWNNLRLVK